MKLFHIKMGLSSSGKDLIFFFEPLAGLALIGHTNKRLFAFVLFTLNVYGDGQILTNR